MVQTRTTDCGNSLRRHWLHGKQKNSRTGTAQRDPESILNHSQRYTDGKPGWYLKHQPGNPRRHCYPCQGAANAAGALLILKSLAEFRRRSGENNLNHFCRRRVRRQKFCSRSGAWNLCAYGAQIMRAAQCKPFQTKTCFRLGKEKP